MDRWFISLSSIALAKTQVSALQMVMSSLPWFYSSILGRGGISSSDPDLFFAHTAQLNRILSFTSSSWLDFLGVMT